ncbi:MAG: glycosyltransferase family 4 protein [Actinomycetota bacterium]
MRILLSAFRRAPIEGTDEVLFVRSLAEQLADRGHQVGLITNQPGAIGPLDPSTGSVDGGGIVVHHLDDGSDRRASPRRRRWYRSRSGMIGRAADASPYDVVHHVGPLDLHDIAGLRRGNVPYVLGPLSGGEVAPFEFRRYFDDDWPSEVWRRRRVRFAIAQAPSIRRAVGGASVVLAANPETANLVRRLGATHVEPMVDAVVPDGRLGERPPERRPSEHLRVLWVGPPDRGRALPLALDILAGVEQEIPVRLRVTGGLPDDPWHRMLSGRPGVAERLDLVGTVGPSERSKLLDDSDILLQSALRAPGAGSMVEAMAVGVPVVALEHQAARLTLADGGGLLLPVTNPADVIHTGAKVLARLATRPEWRQTLATEAWSAAHRFSVAGQTRAIEAVYRRAIDGREPPDHPEGAGESDRDRR